MTPLEGLSWVRDAGHRPALPFHLMRHAGMSAEEIECCSNRSGLKGLRHERHAGDPGAGRDGNDRARLAVEMFCYRIRKYIGAYIAVLGRVEPSFSPAASGRMLAHRERACRGLEHLGISIDEKKNASAGSSNTEIQKDGAPVKVS